MVGPQYLIVGLVLSAVVTAPPNAEEKAGEQKSASAKAADKVDVTGGWSFTVEMAGNSGSPLFTFKQDGETLAGTYKGQFGEAELKGTVKADKIEFAFSIAGHTITYKGTIKKDAIEGEADYAGQATATFKAKKIDLTGTWDVEIELASNPGAPVFTLKQEGEKLSGKYNGRFGEADVKGTIKGDSFEITFQIEGADIAYKGTVDKDKIKGEADYAGRATGEFTGTRRAEDAKKAAEPKKKE